MFIAGRAMKNYHEVDKLHFEKNELVLTIDGLLGIVHKGQHKKQVA